MTLRLYDTHAHLNADDFRDTIDEVIGRASQVGVVAINVIGVDAASSRHAVELARAYPELLHATVGVQPNHVATATDDDWTEIASLAADSCVCAIGETGLDCYWDDAPLDQQRTWFDRHLDLATERSLPVVIHMRESGNEIIEQLSRRSTIPPGVMHSFTGDEAMCRRCLALGLHISFAGMVTFKKSDELRKVAVGVPRDRLLVETDSPYLSPEPLRGKRPNEPARVEHTLRSLARAIGCDASLLAQATTENGFNLFLRR